MADWKGFQYHKDPENFAKASSAVNLSLIESGIDQIINTIPGERRMLPEFGSRCPLLIFEPHDSVLYQRIGREVYNAIKRWEPRVVLENVSVWAVEGNEHAVTAIIRYYLRANRRLASTLNIKVEG